MTLLTVKHLTITDTWTDQPLVSDVNFTLTKGETLGVIGESGSGKSITCKSIIGLNPERLGVTGEIIFDGTSAYGVLFIDAQFEPLRKMEAPMFKKILKNISCLMMLLEQHNNVLKIKA